MTSPSKQLSPKMDAESKVAVEYLPPTDAQNDVNSLLTVALEGTLSIATAGEFYRRLQPLLEQSESIQMDASDVISVDTATLQLLVAFVQDARARGLGVQWARPSQSFCQTAALLDLERYLGLEQQALS